jgi:DNA helicase IV
MRRNRQAHNPARMPFERQFRQLLARQALSEHILRRVSTSFDQTDVDDLADEFANDDGVQRAMDALWPVVTPQQLVARLLSDPRELAACAPKLSNDERMLIARDRADTAWSTADIPLLDEATGLLGEDPRPAIRARARERAERASELEYSQGVLDIFADDDDEAVGAGVSAERLADRQLSTDGMTVAERAYGDADWAYGHIIVDEAQELTPMALRALVRRCPTQSMTLVGDINQASVGLRADWDALLAPQLRSYRREDLTVNYRTPEEIMTLANRVLHRIDPTQTPAAAIRSTGVAPVVRRIDEGTLFAETRAVVDAFLAADDEGTLAVIADDADLGELGSVFEETIGERVWLGTAVDAKGLEFDGVVLVEPGRDPAPSPAAVRDLYVALTRATQTLTILHAAPLPSALAEAL